MPAVAPASHRAATAPKAPMPLTISSIWNDGRPNLRRQDGTFAAHRNRRMVTVLTVPTLAKMTRVTNMTNPHNTSLFEDRGGTAYDAGGRKDMC